MNGSTEAALCSSLLALPADERVHAAADAIEASRSFTGRLADIRAEAVRELLALESVAAVAARLGMTVPAVRKLAARGRYHRRTGRPIDRAG